jgi:hypothetical protein
MPDIGRNWTPSPFEMFMFELNAWFQPAAQVAAEALEEFGALEFYEAGYVYQEFLELAPGIHKDHWPERFQMELHNNADDLWNLSISVGVSDFIYEAVKRYRDAVQRHTWIVFEQYKDQSDYEDWSDIMGYDE